MIVEAPALDLVEPRLIKVRAGVRGAGWAVGSHGVLTAGHVVRPYLNGEVGSCIAVPSPQRGARTFDCSVVWMDEALDLALLEVASDAIDDWHDAVGRGPGPALAEPGSAAVWVEAVGYPNATVNDDYPHPEQLVGWLKPSGGALSRQMPFDVDGSVPETPWLWQGISGAVVRDRPANRILGVVGRADQDRQRRRLYVSTLPDPRMDVEFSAALVNIGATPVLEAHNAPVTRQLLAELDEAGRARCIAECPDAGVFGARLARTDVDLKGNPYFPYVWRSVDQTIQEALDRRVSGTDRRMLLLVGEAMSGKSRAGAQGLMSHATLRSKVLLAPSVRKDLRQIAELAPPQGAVLWLDDLNTYAAALDAGMLNSWACSPGLVVVGTVRQEELALLQGQLELRPAWAAVNDSNLVEKVWVPSQWEEDGFPEDEALRAKVAHGYSLGEVLGAAGELRQKLEYAKPAAAALVHATIDWSRTGLSDPLPEEHLRELWLAYLTPKEADDFANLVDEDQEAKLIELRSWACTQIESTSSSLVRRDRRGLLADGYLISEREGSTAWIPHPVWNAALAHAGDSLEEVRSVAYHAFAAQQYDVADRACRRLVASRDEELSPLGAFGAGLVRERMGDPQGAELAYKVAIQSLHWKWRPMAAINLGVLLGDRGDTDRALEAFRKAVDTPNPAHRSAAAFNIARLLHGRGDNVGARMAYQTVIDSGVHVSPAALYLAELLQEQGDRVGAEEATKVALQHDGQEAFAIFLQYRLERITKDTVNVAQAEMAYQRALDNGNQRLAAKAAVNLGRLLEAQSKFADASSAYELAMETRHPVEAPKAAIRLGALFERQGADNRARLAYQFATEGADSQASREAAKRLARLPPA